MIELGDRRGVWVVRRKGKGRKFLFALRWLDEDGRLRYRTVAGSRSGAERARALKIKELDDRGPAGRMRWRAFVSEDLELQRGAWQPATWAIAERAYRFFSEKVAPGRLCDIDRATIERYRAIRVISGVRPATINKDLTAIAGGLGRAVARGHLLRTPFTGNWAALMVPEPPTRVNVLTQDELELLLRACPGEDWRGLVLTAFYCGLRLGEALALRVGDVDMIGGRLWVRNRPGFRTKSGEDRPVALTKRLSAAIAAKQRRYRFSDPDRLLWGSTSLKGARGGRITIANVSRAFAVIVKRAHLIDQYGRNRFTFHDLRRTAINAWVRGGVEIDIAQLAAGHADIRTTKKYYLARALEFNHPGIAGR